MKNHAADLTMARIAPLSGAGSFSQAVTTWDSSGLNGTEVCESLCESPSQFPCKIWRREGDSNPRYLLSTHAFQACALNHSATSPRVYNQILTSGVMVLIAKFDTAFLYWTCERRPIRAGKALAENTSNEFDSIQTIEDVIRTGSRGRQVNS